jgi:hypothetical protein
MLQLRIIDCDPFKRVWGGGNMRLKGGGVCRDGSRCDLTVVLEEANVGILNFVCSGAG